ncbi:MAG: histidine phosphatase family protein [Clostridia bacterium]|nr:histidine phosphatase family protein [Clostridia bacterium]
MKAYNIYLIRHGMIKENTQGKYIGHTDVELSEEGRAELEKRIENSVYPWAEAVITSPLKRCVQTAEILYPGRETIAIEGLSECNFGEFENKTAEELKDNDTFVRWLAGDPDAVPQYGESSDRFSARVCLAFEKVVDGILKAGTESTAVITHGGVIMAILEAYGIPELAANKWRCDSGCGYVLRVDARMWMTDRKIEVFSAFPYEKEEE